ncbi:hypothetical protein H0H92_002523 [Tricholoma furcatifolium]|nr:hypothetical protein H0H92_002523 [Tricholoma furcatifolium]
MPVLELHASDAVVYTLGIWLLVHLLRTAFSTVARRRDGVQTTLLRGPPSEHFLFGVARVMHDADDSSTLTEEWAKKYGSAFRMPIALGSSRIIRSLGCDAFLLQRGHRVHSNTTCLGEDYCGLKAKAIEDYTQLWDALLDAAPEEGEVIDVQKWLDSIGIAGFGHDFGSLDGKVPIVVKIFESLKPGTGALSLLVDLLSPSKQWSELHGAMAKIADDLLERSRRDLDGSLREKAEEKSLIGLLIKAESANTQLPMTQEEIMAQWTLIELARKPEKQQKLREELSRFSTTDPTWEQLVSDLPFLDAVVHEVLRLQPPVSDTNRIATEDDIIPLSTPVVAASGEPLSSIIIKKGTLVSAPIRAINRSEAFWGPNSKDFEPERWLKDADIPANQFQGHRHILTFSDGPRICLGKSFTLAEFKVPLTLSYWSLDSRQLISILSILASLCVLIRNYTFELPGGSDTKIEKHNSILPRPKVAGQDGAKVPMLVRCVK